MPNGLALAISLLIILMFLAYVISLLLTFFSPFYSTPKKILKTLLKEFKLKKDQKFTDLGCGDGRIIFSVNKMYGCESIGYEVSPVVLMIVKLKKLFLAPFNKKVQIKEESFFNTDLSRYDVIYCCLPEDVLGNLEKKFSKELRKGSRVYIFKCKLPKKKGNEIKINDTLVHQYTY